jgi:hypothetical protein
MKRAMKCSLLLLLLLMVAAAAPVFARGTTEGTAGSAATTGATNEFGWAVPSTTLEFTYYGEQNSPDTVKRWAKIIDQFLLDKFNVKLTNVTNDQDPAERLNLMLASNDYPEVVTILTPSQARQWKDLGKTQNLAPLIDKYGSVYKQRLGDLYKRFREKNGEVHILPNLWGILAITDRAPEIRYDWYRELGEPKISTPDDYYNVLKAMVAKHPTNEKGEKTYALCFIKDRMSYEVVGGMWGLKSTGLKNTWKEDANHNLTFFLNTPEGLALTKWVNRFNVDGLLDPDSFIIKDDDWVQLIANQRLAGHIDSWWRILATQDFWPTTMPGYDDRYNRYIHINVKAPGVSKSTFNPKDASGYYRTIVTDKAKDPAGVIKWLNFEESDMGIKLLGWGVPAEYLAKYTDKPMPAWHFADGKWSFDETEKQKMLHNQTDYETLAEMGQGVKFISMFQGFTAKEGITFWFDQNFNNETWWKKLMNENMKESFFDFSAAYAVELPAENPLAPKWQMIQDMVKAGWVQVVMQPTEAQCVAAYNDLVKKANDAGLRDIEKYYSDQYKAILDSWK